MQASFLRYDRTLEIKTYVTIQHPHLDSPSENINVVGHRQSWSKNGTYI